jgi:restriction system protein
MSVPEFQKFMLPLVEIAKDGSEHSLSEAIQTLANQFQLSEQDRNELLPSGRQARLDNRVGWALTHLRKAGLLERTGRGRFHITDRGRQVLLSQPPEINMRFLLQFPEFVEFRRRQDEQVLEVQVAEQETPEEILESTYQSLRNNLAQELLERVKKAPPKFFENLVVDLLVAMGYGGSRKDAGQVVGQTGDGGVDGIIKEDKLGLDVVYIQAKKWDGTVGRPIVQGFAGALMGKKANKGVLLTTSKFSQDARMYAESIGQKIVLIDGEQLSQFMIDYGIGVTDQQTYIVKRLDLDYFGDD